MTLREVVADVAIIAGAAAMVWGSYIATPAAGYVVLGIILSGVGARLGAR